MKLNLFLFCAVTILGNLFFQSFYWTIYTTLFVALVVSNGAITAYRERTDKLSG